jgi:hypothetical protein
VLLLLLATVLVMMTPFKEGSAWQESVGVKFSLVVLKGIKPWVSHDLNRFLPV